MAKTSDKADNPQRILIVDDDPDIIESVRYALENKGHEVLVALLLRYLDAGEVGHGGPFLATIEPRRVDRCVGSIVDQSLNLLQRIRPELLVVLVEVNLHRKALFAFLGTDADIEILWARDIGGVYFLGVIAAGSTACHKINFAIDHNGIGGPQWFRQ